MEELRRMREEAGLTQVGLARASRVDRGTIIKIESGKRSPSIDTLEKLALAMGIEISDFFPKAQSPLPLDTRATAGPPDAGVEPYALLGRILAERWRGGLQEFKAAPGVQLDTLKAGDCRALMRFVYDVFETTAVYETATEDSPYPRSPGYEAALEEMHAARQEAANTLRPILEHLKAARDTNAEFRKIWEENGLETMMSKAGIR